MSFNNVIHLIHLLNTTLLNTYSQALTIITIIIQHEFNDYCLRIHQSILQHLPEYRYRFSELLNRTIHLNSLE